MTANYPSRICRLLGGLAVWGVLGLGAAGQSGALAPAALTFAAQDLSSSSAVQAVTLSNSGAATLTIAGITASGDFAVSGNTCGGALTAGASCTISVTFTPTAVGVRTGNLTANLGGVQQTTALTGRGIDPTATGSYMPVVVAGPGLTVGQSYTATAISLQSPSAVATDAAGNWYVLNGSGFPDAVFKVTASGAMTFYAGNGIQGYSGDGGPATQAQLNIGPFSSSLAWDAQGNLYIPDTGNCVVREVSAATGSMATVAGNGSCGNSGDGGAATQAELNRPSAVAADAAGDLFIADTKNFAVREVAAGTGVITTVSGTGVRGLLSGASPVVSGVATAVAMGGPSGVAVDSGGNLYIADTNNGVVWKVTAASGQIALYAGQPANGTVCTAASDAVGDGCPATQAVFNGNNTVHGIALDGAGNLYIAATTGVHEVLAANGMMANVAGQAGIIEQTKLASAVGDGGPATQALFMRATGVLPLANGDVLIADGGQNRVRRVSGGVITTVVGNGFSGDTGDGGPPLSAQVSPTKLTVSPYWGLVIGSSFDNRLRVIGAGSDQIDVLAGSGAHADSGDQGPISDASFAAPQGLAADASDGIYVADNGNNAVRFFSGTRVMSTIAGGNGAGYSGDGGAATAAQLRNPDGVAVDAGGDIFIADSGNHVVREVKAGVITTFAGTGASGYSGDGGAATAATLAMPQALAVDGAGNLYIADSSDHVVREVNASTGIITTVAGTGVSGAAVSGGLAAATELERPVDIAVDPAGNLFIIDAGDNAGYEVSSATGIIQGVLGADNGVTEAQGVATDADGNVYVADLLGQQVLEVLTQPTLNLSATTLAFDAENVGTASPSQTVTLTNPSGFPVAIAQIGFSGQYSGDFAENSSCGASVAAGASCTVAVTFAPAGQGSRDASLTITDNAGSGSQTVALSATGTAPAIHLTPANLTFATAPAGTPSVPQTVVVNNPGTGPLDIGSITSTGDNSTISVTDHCPSTLAAGASCWLDVGYTVTSMGWGGGVIQIADNVSGSPQIIGVRGVGTDAAVEQATIATVAGPGLLPGHTYAAAAVSLLDPQATVADAAGNLYVASTAYPNAVLKITPAGTLSFYAGTGVAGDSGDGGPATQAQLNLGAVTGMAVDASGDLYVPDLNNCVVREINAATGVISTVAGDGVCAYGGDGGPATQAELNQPHAVVLDGSGNLYIADTNNYTVREVAASSGVITSVAGYGWQGQLSNPSAVTSGDATGVALGTVNGLAVDAAGDIYAADQSNSVIWKVTAQPGAEGQIAIYAGQTGGAVCAAAADTLGDGCPATQAVASFTSLAGGLALDAAGNLYLATGNGVREIVAASGVIENVAGQETVVTANKVQSAMGDGGAATQAVFMRATGVTVLTDGSLLVTDGGAGRIRRINGGIITTTAGNGLSDDTGDGGPAATAQVTATGTALDAAGDLILVDKYDNAIREITPDGIIHTIAGTGSYGYSGDGGAATAAAFAFPTAAAVSPAGAIVVTDTSNNAIRQISSAGVVATIAGGNGSGYSGDGGAATAARLNTPWGAAFDARGDLFFSESGNNVVREITPDGLIHTYAGTGSAGYGGDGGAAGSAQLRTPRGITVDAAGDVYIADTGNHVVREVSAATGVISTVAGDGTSGMSGLEGPATAAELISPWAVGVDGSGNLFIADLGYPAVYEVAQATGDMHYLTGKGADRDPAYAGPAVAAGVSSLYGITADAAGDIYIADLNGGTIREMKTGAGVGLSAASLNFGSQNVASASAAQTVTVSNNGGAPLTGTAASLAGANSSDFNVTNDCTASVNAGSNCTIAVSFTPTAAGSRSAILTLTDNAGSQTVGLAGTGTVPQAALSVTGLTFASQAVGSASAAQTLTLSNPGTGPLSIQSVSASAPFAATNSCGATLAAGASCTVAVTFAPAATGAAAGTLSVNDDAAGSPQTVALSGSGIGAGLSFTPSLVSFGSVAVGTALAQGVTILNTGGAALHVSGATASGDFQASGNCATIPAASGCSVVVTFTPTVTGVRSGTLSITDDAAGSPQTVPLAGTGIAPGVAVAPASVAFPSTPIAGASFPITVTVTNSGQAELTGLSLATAGDFSQTSTCTGTLAAGGSCAASVVFSPTVAGLEAGTLVVTDNAGTQTAALAGTGLAPGAVLSTAQLLYGGQLAGTTSAAQSVILSNTGASALAITSITPSAGFGEVNGCGTSLAAETSCTISVSFQPAAAGAVTGAVTITDSAGTQSVALSGLGTAAGLTIAPAAAAFGAQMIGTTSASQTLTVTNDGSTALALAPVAASGDFSQVNLCPVSPATLAAGASCLVNVAFTPAVTGERSGTVTVADTAGLAATAAVLSGTGTLPGISATPAAVYFGAQPVGTPGPAQTVTVTNSGTAALQVAAVLVSGDFTQVNTCTTAPIPPGQTCVVSVAIAPTTVGDETGTLEIFDNADGLHAVALGGEGVGPGAAVTPTALAFGSQPVPGANASGVTLTGASQNVVLANNGNTPLTISSITALGPFSRSSDCGTTLAAGVSCTITVSFAPTLLGQMTGVLVIADNSAGGVQTVALNGYGSPNGLVLTPPSFSFGAIPVGQASTPQTATLTNNTGQAISSLTVTASGEFAQTNTCNGGLASGASCQIQATLTPQTPGAITGAISVTGALAGTVGSLRPRSARPMAATASGGLAEIALSGSGDTSGVELSATALGFTPQTVGTRSAAQTVIVTNAGSGPLTGLAVTAAGDFTATTTCGVSLAAGASCAIAVTFVPAAAGTRVGVLSLADNAPDAPQTVALSGTASIPAPAAALSASTLTFASELTGDGSAAQSVTLTNPGAAPLQVSSIAASGDFGVTSNCGASLAAGASCAIAVTFHPTATGARSGMLTVADNAAGSPHTVALAGTGADVSVVGSGPGTSASVIVGGTASFGLSFTPSAGFTGSFALTCTGAPQGASCVPSPAMIALAGTAVPVTVTVTTAYIAAAPPSGSGPGPVSRLAWLAVAWGLAGAVLLCRRRRAWALALLLAAATAACGGISNQPQPGSTPRGHYLLTVTASGTSGTRSATLNLTVN